MTETSASPLRENSAAPSQHQTKLQHQIDANHNQHLVFTNKPITNPTTSKLSSKGHEGWKEVHISYDRELCLG